MWLAYRSISESDTPIALLQSYRPAQAGGTFFYSGTRCAVSLMIVPVHKNTFGFRSCQRFLSNRRATCQIFFRYHSVKFTG